MIKKRNSSYGLNTNVDVDPSASANASPNITNHIYIRDFKKKNNNDEKQNLNFNASAISENNILTRDIDLENEQLETEHITTTLVNEPQKIYAREIIVTTESNNENTNNNNKIKPKTAEQLILDTYAKILLDQNKALLLNLISKPTIIIPKTNLELIINAKTGYSCEITLEDDASCCIAKYNPIKKIETIKVLNEELVTDFKQVYNNYNEFVSSMSKVLYGLLKNTMCFGLLKNNSESIDY